MYSTVLDTAQIEETKKLIEAHTAIIIGFITNNNNAFNAMLRIMERSAPAKDSDSTIAAIKSYCADCMGRVVSSDKLEHFTLTHNFLSTAFNLVDWYGVLSYLQELKDANDLDNHPF